MRIAINGLACSESMTGIGRMTLSSLRAVLRQNMHDEFFLFLPKDAPADVGLEADNLELIRTDVSLKQAVKSVLFEEFQMPRRLRGARIDLYYAPSFLLPAFPGADAEVICVHDLAWRFFPKSKSTMFRTYMNTRLPAALKRAHSIVCVSQSTADDLMELYPKTEKDKVRVVYNGVDLDVFKPGETSGDQSPFVAVVGNQDPRKNTSTLLEAFPIFRARLRPYRLVMVGPGQTPDVKPPAVDVVGWVGDEELASLYRRASMVVQPSLYEGFGLPLLEAMACGTAVACADIKVFREIAHDAAHYFDPRDATSIAKAMEALAVDDSKRERLGQAGLERARGFSWDNSAKDLLSIFREATR
ncbi:MAG: glycosyltransferase family 1 protein [Planctomycetota bacterium]